MCQVACFQSMPVHVRSAGVTSPICQGPCWRTDLAILHRTSAFEVTAQYTPDSNVPPGFDRTLGRFTVKPPSLGGQDKLKLKLKLRLNLNGCVGLEEVQNAVEEEYEDKVPRPAKVSHLPVMWNASSPGDSGRVHEVFLCMFGVRRRVSTTCHGQHGEDSNSGFSQGAVVHDLAAGAALAQVLAVLYRAGGMPHGAE